MTVVVLLAGIWLGGRPNHLPSPLRSGFSESRGLPLVDQALTILTRRYYRPLNRPGLIDDGLSGMVGALDDRYSHYLDPRAYRESRGQSNANRSASGAALPVATARMLTYDARPIGYVHLTGFSDGSGEEVRREVQAALQAHARALILDLRGNGGGLISEAINVASIFIPDGTIMYAEERGQPRRVYMARGDAVAPHIPMVVLVDQATASSAEIVTAALHDRGRAKVVGTRTYGKGVFQLTLPLMNGGALDIAVGQYFTPTGAISGAAQRARARASFPTSTRPMNRGQPTTSRSPPPSASWPPRYGERGIALTPPVSARTTVGELTPTPGQTDARTPSFSRMYVRQSRSAGPRRGRPLSGLAWTTTVCVPSARVIRGGATVPACSSSKAIIMRFALFGLLLAALIFVASGGHIVFLPLFFLFPLGGLLGHRSRRRRF